MKKIFYAFTMLCLTGVFSADASINKWYLKDTIKYENVQITNVFYAPYLHSPRICAYFTDAKGSDDVVGCTAEDNGNYQKNNSGSSPFSYLVDYLRYFYGTGEEISVYIKPDAFSFDSSVSNNEIVAIGTCKTWCFGETIK